MNTFDKFLAQVDPLTIAREAFTGEAHRQMVREHAVKVAAFGDRNSARDQSLSVAGDEYGDIRLDAAVAERLAFNKRKPSKPPKPKQEYKPGGPKSAAYQELQRTRV
ncbi:hypothetical protein E3T46_17530 [Cryobacterium sp. Hh11]|uniref:hypothetical protein n=1 Tax=Cryobacterium sp. Hh11 TaxID=2555868 RepID=UPI00106B9D38|nr:hypothetical protein [Cryobacterium sp. Hh11]TFD47593.1 hypothetical protein E3T46_17530 [Cryobacterium sp. Hh11]